MSNVNQNSSFSDFVNARIIDSIKAVRDNTINTSVGFYVDKEGNVQSDANAGVFVSNANKLLSAIILEETLQSLYGLKAIDKIKNISDDSFNAIGLSIQKQWLSDAVNQLQVSANKTNDVIKKEIYQNSIKSINIQLQNINSNIQSKLSVIGIDGVDVKNSNAQVVVQKIFDKDLGSYANSIDDKIFKSLSHTFNGGTLAFLLSNEIDSKNPEELLDRATYWTNWAMSSILTVFPKWDVPFNDGAFKMLSQIKSLSHPNLTAVAARGVIVGIATDVAFKGGYWLGEELIWGKAFEIAFGQELYEMDWFIEFSDKFYSKYLGHLDATELNAVIAFNTMILGNFVNKQGKSVVMEDTAILFSAKDYQEMSFEKVLHTYKILNKAITGSSDADNITTADEMIKSMEQAYPFFKELRGKIMIIPQDFKEASTYNDLALKDNNEAMAYRFSLKHLLPMVITDLDYSKYNQNGELELYSKNNPNGLTKEYIDTRTQMLVFKLYYSKLDVDYDDRLQILDFLPITVDDYIYQDFDNNLKLDIDGVNINSSAAKYSVFGGDKADKINGSVASDKLFGGKGHDVLTGYLGNDYLEGGAGFDAYHIKDTDTLFDADGKGVIYFDGKALPKDFIKRSASDDIWQAKDTNQTVLFIANKQGNDLVIRPNTQDDSTDQVTLKDFFTLTTPRGDNNSVYSALSIVLADNQEDANKYGTFAIKTDDTLPSNIYTGGFASIHLEITGSDKVDNIFGTGKKHLNIDAGGGSDLIFGGDLADTIRAEDGNDIIYGSSGFYDFEPENSSRLPKPQTDSKGNLIGIDKDLIIGGNGNDLISAGIGNDIIWVDNDYTINKNIAFDKDPNNPNNTNNNQKGDWALGGKGDDVIYGGANKDFLQGGADSDIIYGGGGDDVILRDGHVRFGKRLFFYIWY